MEKKTTMKEPLISIIVPVYNVESYIHVCIDSVITQTYKKWELILVDDGSPDRCPAICDEYAKLDNRINVLHCQNGGLSSARNRALDYPPNGDFVTFLDGDDFLHPNFLESLISLQQNYLADLVQCDFIRGTETIFPTTKGSVNIEILNNHEIFLTEKAKVIMCCKLYRTNLFEGIRMPIGLYNEDDWTTWRLYYKAKTIVTTSEQLYYYTTNPASIMARLEKKTDLRYINAYNERISYFIKTGEKDLEHCSRLQLCKSLVLIYRNKGLSKAEKRTVKNNFEVNWKELKRSPYIKTKYKVLFATFYLMPMLTSKIVSKLR